MWGVCLWALFLSVPDIGSCAGGQGGCSSVCRFMFALLGYENQTEWKFLKDGRRKNVSHWAQLTMVGHQHIEQNQPSGLASNAECAKTLSLGWAWIKITLVCMHVWPWPYLSQIWCLVLKQKKFLRFLCTRPRSCGGGNMSNQELPRQNNMG